LFAADGAEFDFVDRLLRVEVERLLTLQELDAVRVECGGGVASWVGPADARGLWLMALAEFPQLCSVKFPTRGR
jgi:hypothetical protein